jgi:TonB-linked SusC/RagA family outer membrane protein
LNAEERGRVLWQASVNDKTDPIIHKAIYAYDWNGDYTNPILNKVIIQPFVGGDPNVPVGNTDWQEETWDPALICTQDLTVSAGTSRSSLLINMGYYKNTGMLKYTNFERLTSRLNAFTTFFNGKVKIGQNLQMARTSETLTANDLGGAPTPGLSVNLAPTIPVYTIKGDYAGPVGAGYSDRNNPVHMQYINRWDKNNEFSVFGNVYAEISPLKNLLFRTSFGADYSNTLAKNIEPAFQEGFLGRSVNSLSLQDGKNLSMTFTNTLSYQIERGKHRVNALAGVESFQQDRTGFGAFREGFALEDLNYYVLDAGTGRSTNNGFASGYRLFSYFGKLFYGFSDKYLASVTVRRDGSSRFGAANQYGVFPAATLGWRIDKEEFFHVPVVSNLKLRAGVGRVGNQETISDLGRLGLYQTNYGTIGRDFPGSWTNIGTAYDLNGANGGTLPSGYVSIQGENPNLKWESTEELNLGLDFGFINEKISGSFDYFTRKTSDILIQPPVAGAVGEGRVRFLNGATKTNKGWEFLLTYQNVTASGLRYSISGNASHFKDKITVLPSEVRTAYPGSPLKPILGQSQTAIFGYYADGIFQNQREVDDHAKQPGKGVGRIRYRDLNGDGSVDGNDRDWLGNTLPGFEYGLKIDLDYKNFDLSIFGSGVANKKGFDDGKFLNSFLDVRQNNGRGILNAWTPQNPSSNTPMLSLVNSNNENRTSTFFIVNGAYYRLRNVQLGYNLPLQIVQKLKMESLRLYVSGQNLFILKSKEYQTQDPERIGSINNWPQPTTYTVGLNVNF